MSFGSQIEGSVKKMWPSEHEAAGRIASAVRKHGEMSGGTHSVSHFLPSLHSSTPARGGEGGCPHSQWTFPFTLTLLDTPRVLSLSVTLDLVRMTY